MPKKGDLLACQGQALDDVLQQGDPAAGATKLSSTKEPVICGACSNSSHPFPLNPKPELSSWEEKDE